MGNPFTYILSGQSVSAGEDLLVKKKRECPCGECAVARIEEKAQIKRETAKMSP